MIKTLCLNGSFPHTQTVLDVLRKPLYYMAPYKLCANVLLFSPMLSYVLLKQHLRKKAEVKFYLEFSTFFLLVHSSGYWYNLLIEAVIQKTTIEPVELKIKSKPMIVSDGL